MTLKCPHSHCVSHQKQHSRRPKSERLVRKGDYVRKSDSRSIKRWKCRFCRRSFSQATFSMCYGQKKRRLNYPILLALGSNISKRRIALLMGINRKTVERKFIFLAKIGFMDLARRRREHAKSPFHEAFLDELHAYEHTKMKPLSVPLVVTKKREIIHFAVATMPATGRLAERSRRKYGKRTDERRKVIHQLLKELVGVMDPDGVWATDCCPIYPPALKTLFPGCTHRSFKGRRAKEEGLGELKKGGFDPLFWINHTFAMLRSNMSRLNRQTWCSSKKKVNLMRHVAIYAFFHNNFILKNPAR